MVANPDKITDGTANVEKSGEEIGVITPAANQATAEKTKKSRKINLLSLSPRSTLKCYSRKI